MKPIALILCGHASFARGILDALQMLHGQLQDVAAVDLQPGQSEQDFSRELDALLKEFADYQVLYLVDLAGSIPYKAASERSHPRAVIAGINLGLVLEIDQMRHYVQDLNELIGQGLLVGKEQILALEENE